MAGQKRIDQYRTRWAERIMRVVLAALAALATRATDDDIRWTVVALVALMGAGEIVAHFLAPVRSLAELRHLALGRARRLAVRLREGGGGRRRRRRRPRTRPGRSDAAAGEGCEGGDRVGDG